MKPNHFLHRLNCENYILKLQQAEMIKIMNVQQAEHTNHMNMLLILQTKNTQLNQELLEKQNQLFTLMQKYDVPPSFLHS